MKVKVREYDDYGKQVTRLAEYLDSNREKWVGQVRQAVKSEKAGKKPPKKKEQPPKGASPQ